LIGKIEKNELKAKRRVFEKRKRVAGIFDRSSHQ